MTLITAQPQNALAAIFNQSATAAREAFPDKLENLVVFLTSEEAPVYVAPAIAEHLTQNVAAVKATLEFVKKYLHENHAAGIAGERRSIAGAEVSLIAMSEDIGGKFTAGFTKDMWKISAFDHEVGHLVVKYGIPFMGEEHRAECAADVYSALRHVQRFGMNTDFFENNSKAASIVLGTSFIHYTDKAVQRVRQLAKEIDVSKLSMPETAVLASQIAVDYSLSEMTRNDIANAFDPVKRARVRYGMSHPDVLKNLHEDKGALNLFCRETLAVMKIHQNDPDIFDAGKSFLTHPSRKSFMDDAAKTDPYWRQALEFINAPTTTEPKFQPLKNAARISR
jgi:hypothetical protein